MNSQIPPMPPMPPIPPMQHIPPMPHMPQMQMPIPMQSASYNYTMGDSSTNGYGQVDTSSGYGQVARTSSGYNQVDNTGGGYPQNNTTSGYPHNHTTSGYAQNCSSTGYSQNTDTISGYTQNNTKSGYPYNNTNGGYASNDNANSVYTHDNTSGYYNTNASSKTSNVLIKKNQVRCLECNLDFTSQVVLDTHLQGARHAKQLRSKTILAALEKSNVAEIKDKDATSLKCNVCNKFLNSIQQLQTHLNGSRHKKKVSSDNWTGKEIISKATVSEIPEKCLPKPAVRNTSLSCATCNKYFNSESQLHVHLSSQKHKDRLNGKVSAKKKRYSPYWKSKQMNKTSYDSQTPITNNFVSSGYQTY